VIGARAAFSYGAAHRFPAQLDQWCLARQLTGDAITDGLVFMAVAMILTCTRGTAASWLSTGNYTAVINLVRAAGGAPGGSRAGYAGRKARSTSGSGSRPRPGPCGTVIRPRAGVAAPP
jgi:hypothetical protein